MDWDEVEELACLMLGKDYDDMVDYYGEDFAAELDDIFYEKYYVTLEEFKCVLEDLVKFTPTWKSPLTGKLYQGFVTGTTNLGRAIIKKEV